MCAEKVMDIVKRHGRFNVSLRWRDIPLQKECNALVKAGRLKRVGRIKREIVFVLPDTVWSIKSGYLNITPAQADLVKRGEGI